MLFTVEHPLGRPDCSAEFTSNQGLVDFAGAVEDLGFDAIAFTEHPAPSRKWLDSGGHCSVDPLVALGFCAALTTRIRLLTYLLVLPYRNPLLAAKSIATVDVLSNGRLVVGAGSGYLRSEFAALGVDFEQRTQLLDEAIEVLREVWTGESYAHDGLHFSARGQVSLPPPVQLPHPPIWIGGNSRSGRRRVARVAQGWTPLLLDERIATATRTPPLRTPAELATAIKELHQLVAAEGRDPADIEIQVQTPQSAFLTTDTISMEQHRDHLGQLADAGVTSFLRTEAFAEDAGQLKPVLPKGAVDMGNYKPGYGLAMESLYGAAREFGDADAAAAAKLALDSLCDPTTEDGVFRYQKMSNSVNACVTLDRQLHQDFWRRTVVVPTPESALSGPILGEVAYPDVLVARATSNGGDLHLVLFPGREGSTEVLQLARLQPARRYRITGATADALVADAEGRAQVRVVLAGRSEVRVQPE